MNQQYQKKDATHTHSKGGQKITLLSEKKRERDSELAMNLVACLIERGGGWLQEAGGSNVDRCHIQSVAVARAKERGDRAGADGCGQGHAV